MHLGGGQTTEMNPHVLSDEPEANDSTFLSIYRGPPVHCLLLLGLLGGRVRYETSPSASWKHLPLLGSNCSIMGGINGLLNASLPLTRCPLEAHFNLTEVRNAGWLLAAAPSRWIKGEPCSSAPPTGRRSACARMH